MKAICPNSISTRCIWHSGPGLDCIHWSPGAVDPEPEQCWCLRCGGELPCLSCSPQPVAQPIPKESLNV